jgi:hypothetical protein
LEQSSQLFGRGPEPPAGESIGDWPRALHHALSQAYAAVATAVQGPQQGWRPCKEKRPTRLRTANP